MAQELSIEIRENIKIFSIIRIGNPHYIASTCPPEQVEELNNKNIYQKINELTGQKPPKTKKIQPKLDFSEYKHQTLLRMNSPILSSSQTSLFHGF